MNPVRLFALATHLECLSQDDDLLKRNGYENAARSPQPVYGPGQQSGAECHCPVARQSARVLFNTIGLAISRIQAYWAQMRFSERILRMGRRLCFSQPLDFSLARRALAREFRWPRGQIPQKDGLEK